MKHIDKYRIKRRIEIFYDEYGLCINSFFLLVLLIGTWIIASTITGEYDKGFFIDYISKACKYSLITSLFITE